MPTSVFLMNIGNTNTEYSIAKAGIIGVSGIIPTRELTADIVPKGMALAVASVVPEASVILKTLNPFFISTKIRTGVDWSKVDNSTIGADRVANAIHLTHEFSLPGICIDFGTAITFEAVDGNGYFVGGSIAPGRHLLRKALHDYTAQLPMIELFDDIPESGCNTLDAMRIGIDGGAIGMVEKQMELLAHQLGEPAEVIATGGDAAFFLKHIPWLKSGGKDFTIKGILKAWELNCES
ncbi:MAG: type III pantothenate kinase [Victivallales bacterium]|nr:type III pantothenate kinase [Victivallales bacterium]